MKQLMLMVAGCALLGCALTPAGIKWGSSVMADKEFAESIEDAAKDGGLVNLTAEAIDKIAEEVVRKRVEKGMTQQEAESIPVGWRELLEAVAGSAVLVNWIRDRKYIVNKTLKTELKSP
jgi:predicted ABC-type ATPase